MWAKLHTEIKVLIIQFHVTYFKFGRPVEMWFALCKHKSSNFIYEAFSQKSQIFLRGLYNLSNLYDDSLDPEQSLHVTYPEIFL